MGNCGQPYRRQLACPSWKVHHGNCMLIKEKIFYHLLLKDFFFYLDECIHEALSLCERVSLNVAMTYGHLSAACDL